MKIKPQPVQRRRYWSKLHYLVLAIGLFNLSIVSAENPGNPEKGQAIYSRICAACHGPQGKGDGPAGKVLTPPPANFTAKSFKNKEDKGLIETIRNGKPGTGMPPWKNSLSPEQIRDGLAFIRTLS